MITPALEERLKHGEGQDYLKMVARAISSGELTGLPSRKNIAISRGFTRAVLAAAGTVRRVDWAGVQQALDASAPGDTVFVNDGTYAATAQVRLKSGVTLTCNWAWGTVTKDGIPMRVPVSKVKVTWDNLPVGTNWAESKCFALLVPGGTSNCKVEGLGLESNNGVFFLEGNSQNISIIHNDGRWGYRGNYYSRHFVYTPGPINSLILEENYLHGSDTQRSGDRNCELWSVTNLQYNYNIFYNINDGGHFMNLGPDCSYSHNYGRRIHRMGCEVQQDRWPGPDPKNFLVEGNVFFDWDHPYWDSMGMSIPSYSTNIHITRNYVRTNAWQGLWGDADSNGNVRGSYWLECPQNISLVDYNIFGGERTVGGYVRPNGNATIGPGNEGYGPCTWYNNNPVGSEPGSGTGTGTVNPVKYSPRIEDMPKPPPQPVRDAVPPDPQPGTSMQITKAEAFTSFVRLTITGTPTGGVLVQARGGDGKWFNPPFSIVGGKVSFDPEKYKNWWLWFRVADDLGASAEFKADKQLGTVPDPVPAQPTTTEIQSTKGTIVVPVRATGVLDFSKAAFKAILLLLFLCSFGSAATLLERQNNRATLQAIIDALPNLGNVPTGGTRTAGIAHIPAGDWPIDQPLLLKPGVRLKGEGTNTNIINEDGVCVSFYTPAGNHYASSESVEDCFLTSPGDAVNIDSSVTGCEDLVVRNCFINGYVSFTLASGTSDVFFVKVTDTIFSTKGQVRYKGDMMTMDRVKMNVTQDIPLVVWYGNGSITNCWLEGPRLLVTFSNGHIVWKENHNEPHGTTGDTQMTLTTAFLEADEIYFVIATVAEVHLLSGSRINFTRNVDAEDTGGFPTDPARCYKRDATMVNKRDTMNRRLSTIINANTIWYNGVEVRVGAILP